MKLGDADRKLSESALAMEKLDGVINGLKDEHIHGLEELRLEHSSLEDHLHQELHVALRRIQELTSQTEEKGNGHKKFSQQLLCLQT